MINFKSLLISSIEPQLLDIHTVYETEQVWDQSISISIVGPKRVDFEDGCDMNTQ